MIFYPRNCLQRHQQPFHAQPISYFGFQNTAASGSKSILTYFEAHNNAIFDVTWVPGSRCQVVTVSGDQSAKLWDFSHVTTSSEVEEVRVFRFGLLGNPTCLNHCSTDMQYRQPTSKEF